MLKPLSEWLKGTNTSFILHFFQVPFSQEEKMTQKKSKSVLSKRRSSSGNKSRKANNFSGAKSGIQARANEIVSELTDGRSVIRRNLRKSNAGIILGVLGGGVALAFIGRYLFRYYQGHPEIADYLRDRLDGVENRLRSFKGFKGFGGDDSLDVDARH
jgi:hypothetical protein